MSLENIINIIYFRIILFFYFVIVKRGLKMSNKNVMNYWMNILALISEKNFLM